jgi:hypothetical protein
MMVDDMDVFKHAKKDESSNDLKHSFIGYRIVIAAALDDASAISSVSSISIIKQCLCSP